MDSAPVEYQCKLMNNRVDNVGKHFSYFLQGCTSYARKIALLRDKGDDLVDMLTSFADTEPHNATTRRQLHECAHWLAMVEDFRHLAATRLATRISPTLQAYQKTTADLKAHVKKCTVANEKTKASLEVANKVRAKNGDTSAMYHTAFEAYRGNVRETAHQAEILRVHAKEFEEKKLKDTRNFLLDFIRSEMAFHCRAVDMYTAAYRSVQAISPGDDLGEFLDAYEIMDDAGNREMNMGHGDKPNRPATTTLREMREAVAGNLSRRSSRSQPVLNGVDSDERRSVKSSVRTERFNRAPEPGTNGEEMARGPVPRRRQNVPLEHSDTD